jgi:carbonic anhydrase
MRKLIEGILDFRRNMRPTYAESFAKLALGQTPDTLFVACSDSRVVPNLFISTNPGDLFVLRNVGNLMPPSGGGHMTASDESEPAAIEFALLSLKIRNIVICGHSECGAMKATLAGGKTPGAPNLESWLRHTKPAMDRLESGQVLDERPKHDQLSQLSVLAQLENCLTYPMIRERVITGEVELHGWWFDIRAAEVLAFDPTDKRFVTIDEANSPRLLARVRG